MIYLTILHPISFSHFACLYLFAIFLMDQACFSVVLHRGLSMSLQSTNKHGITTAVQIPKSN